MDEAKYIIFDAQALNLPLVPLVFPHYLKHEEMAQRFPMWQPIGAGTVKFFVPMGNKTIPICSGKSIGLGISSRGGVDAKIISEHFNM